MKPRRAADPAPAAPMSPPPPSALLDARPAPRGGPPGGRAAAGAGAVHTAAVDAATLGRWRARLDALTRWCLSEAPLAPSAAVVAAATRPTLGDLLRRALSRAGDGVVELLDALDAPADPANRQRLARVLGADVLLVVVAARDGAVARAEARACRTPDEARALVGAFLGGAVPPWMPAAGAHVRDAIASPLLSAPLDGSALASTHAAFARLLSDTSVESTLVLPLLDLAGGGPEVPPVSLGAAAAAAPSPAILGGVLPPGSAFLGASGLGGDVMLGAPGTEAYDEDDDADDGADDEGDEPEAPDAPAAVLALDPMPELVFGDLPAPAGLADQDSTEDDEPPAPAPIDARAALERVRARQAPADRVPVTVTSDDGVAEHVADAAAWLAEASDQELRALARGGWSGDTAVELALAADDPEIEDVARQARRHEAELVVEIDGDAAVAWLRRHRPDTAERLAAVL